MSHAIDPAPPATSDDVTLAALALAGIVVAGAAGPRVHVRRLHEAFGASIAGAVVGVGWGVDVAFDLPAATDFIRLDICALAGRYRIGGIALDGALLSGLAPRRVAGAAVAVAADDDGGALCFEAVQGRPVVELDVRGLVPAPVRMVVSIRREAAPDLQARVLAGLEDLAAGLCREAAASTESDALLGRQLQAQAGQLAALAAEARDARQLAVAQLARIEELHAASAATAEGIATLGADLTASTTAAAYASEAATQAASAAASQATDALLARVDALHAQVRATAATAASGTAAGIEATRGDLALLRAEIAELAALVREGWLRRALRRLGMRT